MAVVIHTYASPWAVVMFMMRHYEVCDHWPSVMVQVWYRGCKFRKTQESTTLSLSIELVLRCHKVFIVKLWKEGRLNYLGFVLTRVPNMLTELHCNQSLKPYTVHQGFVSPWTLQGYGGYFSLFTYPLLAVCCLLFTNLQAICQWHSTTFNKFG